MRLHRFVAFAVTLAALSALTACSRSNSAAQGVEVSAEEAAELLVNRNWLDRWPESMDSRLRVYRFVPSMGSSGVFHDRTLFKGSFELFLYQAADGSIEFHMPDTDERTRTRFRIERVPGPKPFDLRLTLSQSPRGPRVFYGMSSESAATLEELDRLLIQGR